MNSKNKTLKSLSYGLSKPQQLLEKLKMDAQKLTSIPHPHDIFNFIVTAAVLGEWTQKYYETAKSSDSFRAPSDPQQEWELPSPFLQWIADTSWLPNPEAPLRNISHMLSICAHTANASKHFHWKQGKHFKYIGSNPPIENGYQYFNTSTKTDLYITFKGENYGLQQIKGTLLQFYEGLLKHLDSQEGENNDV